MLLTKGVKDSTTLVLPLIHSNFTQQVNSLPNWFALRNSLVVQWLGLGPFTARVGLGLGSLPD